MFYSIQDFHPSIGHLAPFQSYYLIQGTGDIVQRVAEIIASRAAAKSLFFPVLFW